MVCSTSSRRSSIGLLLLSKTWGAPKKTTDFLAKMECVSKIKKKENVAQQVAVISDLATQDGHIDQELLGYDPRKCADYLKMKR